MVINVMITIGVIVILPNLMTIMEDILDVSLEHVDAGGNMEVYISLKYNLL